MDNKQLIGHKKRIFLRAFAESYATTTGRKWPNIVSGKIYMEVSENKLIACIVINFTNERHSIFKCVSYNKASRLFVNPTFEFIREFATYMLDEPAITIARI